MGINTTSDLAATTCGCGPTHMTLVGIVVDIVVGGTSSNAAPAIVIDIGTDTTTPTPSLDVSTTSTTTTTTTHMVVGCVLLLLLLLMLLGGRGLGFGCDVCMLIEAVLLLHVYNPVSIGRVLTVA